MTYYSNNFDEEFFHVRKWTDQEADESYSELQKQFREFERLTAKSQSVDEVMQLERERLEPKRSRRHFKVVALLALLSSMMFLSAMLADAGNSASFPLTYIVAFFISFALSIAMYAESKGPGSKRKAD